jgi:hypothetical protein
LKKGEGGRCIGTSRNKGKRKERKGTRRKEGRGKSEQKVTRREQEGNKKGTRRTRREQEGNQKGTKREPEGNRERLTKSNQVGKDVQGLGNHIIVGITEEGHQGHHPILPHHLPRPHPRPSLLSLSSLPPVPGKVVDEGEDVEGELLAGGFREQVEEALEEVVGAEVVLEVSWEGG